MKKMKMKRMRSMRLAMCPELQRSPFSIRCIIFNHIFLSRTEELAEQLSCLGAFASYASGKISVEALVLLAAFMNILFCLSLKILRMYVRDKRDVGMCFSDLMEILSCGSKSEASQTMTMGFIDPWRLVHTSIRLAFCSSRRGHETMIKLLKKEFL